MKDKVKKGEHLLVQWKHDEFWYPATVLRHDRDLEQCTYVRFDDGDKQWCNLQQMLPIDIEVGDRVHARWNGEDDYLPALVEKVSDDRSDGYQLHFPGKGEEWTPLSMMRVTR